MPVLAAAAPKIATGAAAAAGAGSPLGAALLTGGSILGGAFSPFQQPGSNDARSTGFATMNSPFIVGGSAVESADPVSRSLKNLVPVLIVIGVAWLALRK